MTVPSRQARRFLAILQSVFWLLRCTATLRWRRNNGFLAQFTLHRQFSDKENRTYPLASGATVVERRVGQADLTTTTITGPVEMWANPIFVEFRQQDLTLSST